jgi:uncharacterized protein YyaL (SSP411 family)
MMAEVFARLFHLTGDPAWRTRADAAIRRFTGDEERLMLMPTLLASADFLEDGAQVAVAGSADHPLARRLARAALAAPDPAITVLRAGSADALPADHVAYAKAAGPEGAAAYVCRRGTCSMPLADPVALTRDLRSRA